MPEERQLVTVLCAEIVGSAAIGSAQDPELVRSTLTSAFAEMRKLLEAHGGTVEKFIGDAVMAVFGVPHVHDDDADRALRAAFALRARIADLSTTLPLPLRLCIGADTGRVVAGIEVADTLVTGGAVNAAARLQQAAAPDEILVGALTRRLVEGSVRFGPARQIDAKASVPWRPSRQRRSSPRCPNSTALWASYALRLSDETQSFGFSANRSQKPAVSAPRIP